ARRRRCVAARADRSRIRGVGRAACGDAPGGAFDRQRVARRRHPRGEAAPRAPPRRYRAARLRPHTPPADDPPCGRPGMSALDTRPAWASVIAEHAVEDATARRLIAQLVALEVASLALC